METQTNTRILPCFLMIQDSIVFKNHILCCHDILPKKQCVILLIFPEIFKQQNIVTRCLDSGKFASQHNNLFVLNLVLQEGCTKNN